MADTCQSARTTPLATAEGGLAPLSVAAACYDAVFAVSAPLAGPPACAALLWPGLVVAALPSERGSCRLRGRDLPYVPRQSLPRNDR